MTEKKFEVKEEELKKVSGGKESLGAFSDWYDLISEKFSSPLPVVQKENQLNEMKDKIRQDSRLTQMEKNELCNYINGLVGNGR